MRLMATVQCWTGAETKALRQAMRLSVRRFAAYLGIDARTVNKWEARHGTITLRPHTQELMDTALQRAPEDVQTRFTQIVGGAQQEEPTNQAQPAQGSAAPAAMSGLDAATKECPAVEESQAGAVNRRCVLGGAFGAGAVLYPRNVQVMGPRELVLNAARSSTILRSAIEAPKIEGRTLEEAQEDLRSLATGYVVNPEPTRMVPDLVILRDRLYMLLARYGQRPSDARELNLLLGATCVLLASVSHDLGQPGAAMVQTRAALAFAELAEHPGLITWVHCTRAMIASWWGSAEEVLNHAQQARAAGLSGVGAIRLAGLEARALAQSGQREQVVGLLRAAQDQRDKLSPIDSLRDLGEAFTFSVAREHYYNAAAYACLGDWEAVEREASRVISLYGAPETDQCWPVTMTLARVHLAQARLSLSGPEGAQDVLAHVFGLPSEQRIPQTVQALSGIQRQLRSKIYTNLTAVRDLDEAIRDFRLTADSEHRP